MQSYTEIPLSERTQYATNFREALQAVCESPAFRTSPKSCEFLRHIVHRALSGDADELKERLIGMSLLGRAATYDTGSDAGVRVRANDVRKRLAVHNKAKMGTVDLPSICLLAPMCLDSSGRPLYLSTCKLGLSGFRQIRTKAICR
jgi:hypothetical protein